MKRISPSLNTLAQIQYYINQGFTTKKIAKLLKVSPTTIHKYTIKYLKTIPNTERSQNFKIKHSLSNIQYEVLIGSLLGDTGMERRYRNARLSITHGDGQEEYFDHKCEIFKNLINTVSKIDRFDKRTNKFYNSYKTHSITNDCFNEIYEMFYSSGKKRVTQQILNLLTPRSLAYWFMDDGSNRGILATNSYSKEECELIKDYFKTTWQIDTTIQITVNNQPLVYFTRSGKQKFWELTHEYFIPSMLYKLENWNP